MDPRKTDQCSAVSFSVMQPSISAIIPVRNNASTIERVVSVVRSHPAVDDVIVIDESDDGSDKKISAIPGILLVHHAVPHGKAAAVLEGLRLARHDTILGVDADMKSFTTDHLDALMDAHGRGFELVVAYNELHFIFDWVNGTRIYSKSAVMPYADILVSSGYGLEQIINFAHRNKRKTLVHFAGADHILKFQKFHFRQYAREYLREGWDLLRTAVLLRFYSR